MATMKEKEIYNVRRVLMTFRAAGVKLVIQRAGFALALAKLPFSRHHLINQIVVMLHSQPPFSMPDRTTSISRKADTWQLPTFSEHVYVIENANKYFKFFIYE